MSFLCKVEEIYYVIENYVDIIISMRFFKLLLTFFILVGSINAAAINCFYMSSCENIEKNERENSHCHKESSRSEKKENSDESDPCESVCFHLGLKNIVHQDFFVFTPSSIRIEKFISTKSIVKNHHSNIFRPPISIS